MTDAANLSRRKFLRAGIAAGASAALPVADSSATTIPFAWNAKDRLDQGPFTVTQDDGWRTLAVTTASKQPLRNFGLGLVGYTWEENGPSLRVRNGKRKSRAGGGADGKPAVRRCAVHPL